MKSHSFLEMAHTPVLLSETIKMLDPQSRNIFVDATLGLGGHTSAMLQENPCLQVFGFDQDEQARKIAQNRLSLLVQIIPKNFECLESFCLENKISPDAILFDIGVSSLHFDTPERGFSFRFDAPLDMRMNLSSSLTAEEVLNTYSEEKLEYIFRNFGEEPEAKRLSSQIVQIREHTPFTSTQQLADFISAAKRERKRFGAGHPASLVFQSLRMEVNHELDVLEKGLRGALHVLAPFGRIAVISFHSREDAIVKNIFKEYAKKEKLQKYPNRQDNLQKRTEYFKILTSKPILPSQEEIQKNPRSRSAKMRVIEKLSF